MRWTVLNLSLCTGRRRSPIFYLRFLLSTIPKSSSLADQLDASERSKRLIGTQCNALFDRERVRRETAEYITRSADKSGIPRQMAAIMCSADRTAKLRALKVPCLVVHGTADPLIPPSNGRAVAAAVGKAGCRLVELEGMGHDLPPVPQYLGRLLDLIEEHAHGKSI
eukprot:SAG31_NODE_4265_length_3394_cov_1.455842_4_plen_167_part_00